MKIIVRFNKSDGEVQIGNERFRFLDMSLAPLFDVSNTVSKICDALAENFYVEGLNYAHLFSYFFRLTSNYFSSAGVDYIVPILKLLDEHINDDVELDVEDSLVNTFKDCAGLVCKKKGLKLSLVHENYIKRKLDLVYNNHFFVRNELRARLFLRYAIGRLRWLLRKHNKKPAKVLFLTNVRFSDHNEANNKLFGRIIQGLNNSKVIRYEKLTQSSNFIRYIKEFMMEPVPYIGDYYSLKHFFRCEKDLKKLKKIYQKLKGTKQFKELFQFKGYNFYHIIKPRLELVFNALNYIACDDRYITQAIIKKENYKLLVIDHEENLYGKGFMLNTREDPNKKTLALSYELIYPGGIYTHIKNPKVNIKGSKLWRPLPDVKCVWSDYTKQVLESTCNYPPNLIKVTGNPKFDFIFNSKFDKKKIIKKYRLSNKPKIFIPLQNYKDMLPIIEQIASEAPEFEVIAKPHPNQDMSLISEFIKKCSLPNLKIVPKFSHLYEIISVSDFIVTRGSSVGFEAMLMGKIVFILNFNSNFPDVLQYIKSGAAIEVDSTEKLKQEISKLENKAYQKEQLRKVKAYINKMHYKNDGKAAERITKRIKQFI